MSRICNLGYYGEISAVQTVGAEIVFVTTHPHERATSLYLIDAENNKLAEVPLPCGGQCLLASESKYFVGGTDRNLYEVTSEGHALKKIGKGFPGVISAMVALSNSSLGLLIEQQVHVVDKKGKTLQVLECNEAGTAIAANSDGQWLAVGTAKGNVCIFQAEEQDAFEPSESAQLHGGAVTSILFEPRELRFFSAGSDRKLLVTHARGKLEPEDRGRANTHKDEITSLVLANESRLITGSRDQTCKSWAITGRSKPSSQSDGLIAISGLAVAVVHERKNLVAVCKDQSIRMFLIDEDGRIGAATGRFNDGYTRAKSLFESVSPADRGNGMQELASYGDHRSIEMLAGRVNADPDHKLRLTAVQLLAKSNAPDLVTQLEKFLDHDDGPVRAVAFNTIEEIDVEQRIALYEKTIGLQRSNIGLQAVSSLGKMARDKKSSIREKNQAKQILKVALTHSLADIRQTAMFELEAVFDKKSPQANLLGLDSNSRHAQQMGLIRLYQRGMLATDSVRSGLRQAVESREPETRQTAFLVSLLARPDLLEAVRARIKEIHRLVHEIESVNYEKVNVENGKAKGASKRKSKVTTSSKSESEGGTRSEAKQVPKQPRAKTFKLVAEDWEPLLIGISSRHVDTCLLGAMCLAALEDTRSFGVLLQLSREEDAAIRVQVAQSLGSLKDQRALGRLSSMLADSEPNVRDAAYSAVESICTDDSRLALAAQFGLQALFADTRKRGLNTLVKLLKKAKSPEQSHLQMLKSALSDDDPEVRSEAFKFSLNTESAGNVQSTLRIILDSIHADVRKEVLTELIAVEKKEEWACQMIVEMLDDADETLRHQAFDFLEKKYKSNASDKHIGWLESAVTGQHADIRKRTCEWLVKIATPESQRVLQVAVNDSQSEIRMLALRSLVVQDAVEVLVAALESQYVSVQLSAAIALAKQADGRAKDVLLDVLQKPWPEDEPAQDLLRKSQLAALEGLKWLGDPQTVDTILEHCKSEDSNIQTAAANALLWMVHDENLERINPLLKQEEGVRLAAAVAMTLANDAFARKIVFADKSFLTGTQHLLAAAAAGRDGERRLVELLDHDEKSVSNAAFLIMLFRDWLQPGDQPERLISCMGAENPRLRFLAARGLDSMLPTPQEETLNLLADVFNDRGDQKNWGIPCSTIELAGRCISSSNTKLRAAVAEALTTLADSEQASWDQAWSLLQRRFSNEIEAIDYLQIEKPKYDVAQLTDLIFGTLVGLAREQGGMHHRSSSASFGRTVFQIRSAAIKRLAELASNDRARLQSAIHVVTHTCGDPISEVRSTAFETLERMGVSDAERARIGIESGFPDLGRLGLDLLIAKGSAKSRREILEKTVLDCTGQIAQEAANRLKKEIGAAEACRICLDSPDAYLPQNSVLWLREEYETNDKCRDLLRELAVDPRDMVRKRALTTLVQVKDSTALERVHEFILEARSERARENGFRWLATLGDVEAAPLLVQLLVRPEFDPQARRILSLAASFRNSATGSKLLEMLETKPYVTELVAAVKTIAGFDQKVEDPDDCLPHRDWMEGQHPRDGKLLADLLEVVIAHGSSKEIRSLLPAVRWCLTSEVDAILARLLDYPDVETRRSIVEAFAFRVEKREAPKSRLIELLDHRDHITQFRAAQGLATVGDPSGLQILLTAVELLDDLQLRREAVLALGRLADERCVDLLLKLVTDDGHALQNVAAESIGHLGTSSHQDEILELLQGFVSSDTHLASRALVGLRWLNHPEGWQTIRDRITQHPFDDARREAIHQLGFNSAPETKELFLIQLENEPYDTLPLLESARRSFGDQSLEPDIAFLRGRASSRCMDPSDDACLQRLSRSGSTSQLFEVVKKCNPEVLTRVSRELLMRTPLALEEAMECLDQNHPRVVQVAAHLIGMDGSTKQKKQIASTLEKWLGEFSKHRDKLRVLCVLTDSRLQELEACVKRLIWTAAKTGGNESLLLQIASDNQNDGVWTSLRLEAMRGLESCKLTTKHFAKLETLVSDTEFSVREVALRLLLTKSKSDVGPIADALFSERHSRNWLFGNTDVRGKDAVISQAVASPHYQARVLPGIVKNGHVQSLIDVANDASLEDRARLGAIEGLARMAVEEAEQHLESLGKDEGLDESLRKAAWRGLARSRRARSRRTGSR